MDQQGLLEELLRFRHSFKARLKVISICLVSAPKEMTEKVLHGRVRLHVMV